MPFTTNEFLSVFRDYNTNIWPFQIVLFISAIYAIFLVLIKKSFSDLVISCVLAFYWIWTGVIYHLIFFTKINPAAYAFGIIFIIQGLLFIKSGVSDKKLEFERASDLKFYLGGVFILYSLIIYPVLGFIFGHTYPNNPTFGLPCPTTIFTFGMLLWTNNKMPVYIIGIPSIWSILGFTAAINLGIKEDIGLLIAGILGSGFIIKDKMRQRRIANV